MYDFDLTGELSLKFELHMLRPITEKSTQWRWANFVSGEKTKKWSNGENSTNFCIFSRQNTNLDTFLDKISKQFENVEEMLSEKGVIR